MTSGASRKAVLLLTHSADFYTVELVGEALARRGARPFRLNTDRFPASVRLSARLGNDRSAHLITDAGARLSAEEVRAVWARKLWAPRMDEDLDERFRGMCLRESAAAFEGFLDALRGARWVNELLRVRAAENKQRQLRVAAEAGLRVPRTLVTNDPAAARQFFEETEGRMVAKLLRPLTVGMDADSDFVYTSRVSAEDLAAAETLRHSPMVFQELIPKARELRIAWVAGQAFAGALEASGTSRGQTDWRRAAPEECRWERGEIPAEVSSGLRALMSELGLVFGAIDLICTPAGEHVFLEVNPAGEFFWLERHPGLPVSEAIADVLLGLSPRRQSLT
jgi:MvdC family ATP-grasp ribosomal peptide maturase